MTTRISGCSTKRTQPLGLRSLKQRLGANFQTGGKGHVQKVFNQATKFIFCSVALFGLKSILVP